MSKPQRLCDSVGDIRIKQLPESFDTQYLRELTAAAFDLANERARLLNAIKEEK